MADILDFGLWLLRVLMHAFRCIVRAVWSVCHFLLSSQQKTSGTGINARRFARLPSLEDWEPRSGLEGYSITSVRSIGRPPLGNPQPAHPGVPRPPPPPPEPRA